MERIYLDNASTTKPCTQAVEAAMSAITEGYGNPSSRHLMGLEAERTIKGARKAVATRLGVNAGNLYFTSGGTESNNLAIIGSSMAFRQKGRILTTRIEHKSVLNPFAYLEKEGFIVDYIDVDKHGVVNLNALEDKLCQDVQLVSMMMVNNEIGSIQPIEQAYQIIKNKSNALFHVDAVQGLCKINQRIKADLISVSAHKIGGLKGCGALYIADKVKIKPLFYGGGQEQGVRVGTENVPSIAAFGAACRAIDIEGNYCKVKELNTILRSIEGAEILSPIDASPYILSIGFAGAKSEVLLHSLEQKGIYVSSGSACSSNKQEQSHVLTAMGCSRSIVDSSIRISLCGYNTLEEVKQAVIIISQTAKELVKIIGAKK